MKRIIVLILVLSQFALSQSAPNKYEAELMKNPNKGGKDTREVNAVLIFEKDVLRINSRRKQQTFKEFKYSDIKYVEHSYSKSPLMSDDTKSVVWTLLFANPLLFMQEEKHWLTILSENDFAVLKIENDNYRLMKMEFLVRDFEIVNINENRE